MQEYWATDFIVNERKTFFNKYMRQLLHGIKKGKSINELKNGLDKNQNALNIACGSPEVLHC